MIFGQDLTRPEICILKLPIKLGETWTENILGVSGQIKMESIEPFEMPDGRVVNCLKTSFVTKYETCYNYYAPGLGLVKSSSVRKDGTKREYSLKRIRNTVKNEEATSNLAIMDDESKSSFQKILFTEPKSGESIRLISATQCEVTDKDAILLADYSIEKDAMEGNKLRIVTRVGGNNTVSYLAIRPAGLISLKDRKVFLFAAILNKLRKTCPMDAYAECLEVDFDRFYAALEDYKLNFMNYPSSHQGLNALLEKHQVVSNPHYWMPMTNIPFDPWGSPYRYHFPGKKQTAPEIISNGPDRKECTADDISSQDISINIEVTRKSFYHPSAMQEKIVGFWELGGYNWQIVAHFEDNGKVTLTEKHTYVGDDEFQPEPVSGTYTIEAGPYTNLSPGLFGQVAKLKLHPTNQLNRLGDNELIVLLDLIDNSLARVIPVLPERVDAMERLRYDDQKSYLWRRIEKN